MTSSERTKVSKEKEMSVSHQNPVKKESNTITNEIVSAEQYDNI